MTKEDLEEERFVKSYPQFCCNGKPLSPFWDLWEAGTEFGFNKANEWHYVSKGEMPTDEKTILIYLKARFVLGWYKFGFWYSNDGEIEEEVIAWKEIVLPELKEIE